MRPKIKERTSVQNRQSDLFSNKIERVTIKAIKRQSKGTSKRTRVRIIKATNNFGPHQGKSNHRKRSSFKRSYSTIPLTASTESSTTVLWSKVHRIAVAIQNDPPKKSKFHKHYHKYLCCTLLEGIFLISLYQIMAVEIV